MGFHSLCIKNCFRRTTCFAPSTGRSSNHPPLFFRIRAFVNSGILVRSSGERGASPVCVLTHTFCAYVKNRYMSRFCWCTPYSALRGILLLGAIYVMYLPNDISPDFACLKKCVGGSDLLIVKTFCLLVRQSNANINDSHWGPQCQSGCFAFCVETSELHQENMSATHGTFVPPALAFRRA